MRLKGQCHLKLYQLKKQQLAILENLSQNNHIDLYYGDETKISQTGYVPYGWQHKDENISISVQRGKDINCFGLLSRTMQFHYQLSETNMTANDILTFIDEISLKINKYTVLVLDNARVHTAKVIQKRLKIWQQRGLFIFYLPPYSPQLNIIERLWKEVKQGWLRPCDYVDFDSLRYGVNRVFANIGS
ncbi:IS630 family transposase, partial [Moraxella catarrhalis]